jgi:hypothetical protein
MSVSRGFYRFANVLRRSGRNNVRTTKFVPCLIFGIDNVLLKGEVERPRFKLNCEG